MRILSFSGCERTLEVPSMQRSIWLSPRHFPRFFNLKSKLKRTRPIPGVLGDETMTASTVIFSALLMYFLNLRVQLEKECSKNRSFVLY